MKFKTTGGQHVSAATKAEAAALAAQYGFGEIAEIVAEPKKAGPAVREGAVFGAWDGGTQAWMDDEPATLAQAAKYHDPDEDVIVAFRMGDYCPKPLNAAEKAALKLILKEKS